MQLFKENSDKNPVNKVHRPGGLETITPYSDDLPVDGWYAFPSRLAAYRGGINWTPDIDIEETDYNVAEPSHLRIYGLENFPAAVALRYPPDEPPLEYNFGLLGLQKQTLLGATDLGDIPEMIYSRNGVPVCRRKFTFAYSQAGDEAAILTVTETPAWSRNDGAWVEGLSSSDIYEDERYNTWRDSARQRIWAALKTWIPKILVALEEVADVPAGEVESRTWFALNHAAEMNFYLATGDKTQLTASLDGDETAWISERVPANTVRGQKQNATVRSLIKDALR